MGISREQADKTDADESMRWPEEQLVSVNGTAISTIARVRELQYHPAASQEVAMYLATRALVIRELLIQRMQHLGIQTFREGDVISEEQALQSLIEREVHIPEVDEATVVNVYNMNLERYMTPPRILIRHILLPAAQDDDQRRMIQRELADQLITRLQQGEDFSGLAFLYSACPSKEQGGSLGEISLGQTVPEFERQVLRFPVGLVICPIETRYGFHVINVDQRIEGEQIALDRVSNRIKTSLAKKAWHKAVAHYLQVLVNEAVIEGIDLGGVNSPLLQ